MKKRNIIPLLLIALLPMLSCLFTSCKDETGQYVEQLYTNSEKNRAVKACLKVSADSAVNHLFKHNGFYDMNDYRIDFSTIENTVFDTLDKYGKSDLKDSLILLTNRMVEGCGAQLTPLIKKAIDTLEIFDAERLIKGAENAITRYFQLQSTSYLKNLFQSPISIRMNVLGINNLWNEVYKEYIKHSSTALNFDVQNYVVEKVLFNIYNEMEIEEYLIRTDSTHRGSELIIFK